MALCAAIFWGTFFPLISELFTGEKASLAAPWFDRYTTPLAILLVLFTGDRPSARLAAGQLGLGEAGLRPAGRGRAGAGARPRDRHRRRRQPLGPALFAFAAFAITGLTQEFWRGAAARRRLSGGSLGAALLGMVSRNRRRYGGYIVHAGVAVLLVGVAASSSFQTKRDLTLKPGESAEVDGRTVTYVKPTVGVGQEAFAFGAVLGVDRGASVSTAPERRFFRPTGADRRRSPASSKARRRARSG